MHKENKKYQFFSHKECPFFPCHPVENPELFNCLFCYCPLYALGDECGGNFSYTEKNIKDCSNCALPHSPGGYEYITKRFPAVAELTRKK